MHDRFTERDQLQRLYELLARDVLTEKATSTCLKRGKDVIRGVRPSEDNNSQTPICRMKIGDARIYSLPLTKAEIVADMHGSVHTSGLQAAASDHSRTPPRPEDQKEECSGSPDPEDKNLPSAAATLAALGPPPSSGPSRKAANLSDARSRGAKPEQDEDAEICTRGGT